MEPSSENPISEKESTRRSLTKLFVDRRKAEIAASGEADRSMLASSRVEAYDALVDHTVQDIIDQTTPSARGRALSSVTLEMGAALGPDFTPEVENMFLGNIVLKMAERVTPQSAAVPQQTPKA